MQGHEYYQQNESQSVQNLAPEPLLPAPISASVPRFCFENDKYRYIIECTMDNGSHWELARLYQNFYDFQIALLQAFPKEAGLDGGPRSLPFMPGPVTYVTDMISNGRRENLDIYVRKLLELPEHISKCQLVRELFAPREGDYELEHSPAGGDYRLSAASHQSSNANDLSRTASRQSSRGVINGNGGYPPGSAAAGQQRSNYPRNPQSMNGSSQSHYRSPSEAQYSTPMNRQASSLTQPSLSSIQSAAAIPGPNASTTNIASGGALKIKVFFDDDLIAIRVPSDISFQQLKDKLKDRLKVQEDIVIRYKDEPSGSFAELISDRDLDVALQRNPKLVLYVGTLANM